MPDNRRELIKYRLESAKERLNSAEVLLASKSYKDSIGRSYYAMFTAVRALLAKMALIIQNMQESFPIFSGSILKHKNSKRNIQNI